MITWHWRAGRLHLKKEFYQMIVVFSSVPNFPAVLGKVLAESGGRTVGRHVGCFGSAIAG